MEIYLWAVVLITLYSFACYWLPDKLNPGKIFIVLTSLHLIFIQGLRSTSVGGDLIRYENHYMLSTMVQTDVFFESRFEIGYQLINFLFASLGISFQGFIFIVSIFVFTILGIFIYKYSESPWLSYMFYLVLGIFDFGFSGLRQIIAMSIILLSYRTIIDKNWKRFLMIVIIATMFHKSAVVFIIIYPLNNWKLFKKIYRFFYLAIVGLVLLLGNFFSQLATSFFNEEYLSVLVTGEGIGGTAIVILIILIFAIFSKYTINDLYYSQSFNVLLIILTVSFLIQLMSSYSYYFTRINLIFFQFIIIIVPNLYKVLRNSLSVNNKFSVLLMNLSLYTILSLSFFFYYQIYLTSNPHMIVPHQFFWQ